MANLCDQGREFARLERFPDTSRCSMAMGDRFHLRLLETGDNDDRRSALGVTQRFQNGEAVGTRIDIDHNKIDIVETAVKNLKSLTTTAGVSQTMTGSRGRVGDDTA